jgi:hypothetical protein
VRGATLAEPAGVRIDAARGSCARNRETMIDHRARARARRACRRLRPRTRVAHLGFKLGQRARTAAARTAAARGEEDARLARGGVVARGRARGRRQRAHAALAPQRRGECEEREPRDLSGHRQLRFENDEIEIGGRVSMLRFSHSPLVPNYVRAVAHLRARARTKERSGSDAALRALRSEHGMRA